MTHTMWLPLAAAFLSATAHAGAGPTADELRAAAGSTDWLLPNHSYAGQRHVDLKQIDRDNAAQLRPVCTVDLDETSRFAAAPLVHRGVMYVTSGDATVALDAATCALRWRHDWQSKGMPTQSGPRKVINAFKSGGAALQDGKLVRATSDGHLVALDVVTGQPLWARPIANPDRYEFVTMAPLTFADQVIAGIGISEYAVRGWIGAFKLSDGAPLWRFNTVPDQGEPGADTWSDAEARSRGGGGVWTAPALDPDAGLLYAAVGNPVPDLYGDVRQGANLYTGALVVLDVKTGALRWHRQFVAHDLHDWDMTAAGPLYRIATPGAVRAMVAAGGKDGLLRGLDRETHEQLFSVPVTTRSDVDRAPTVQGVYACPGILGGMQWSGPAFDPGLGMLYAPAVDWCGRYRKADELRLIRGQLYLGGSFNFDPAEQARGWLTAIDAATGEVRWRYESAKPMLAAVTTTAAGLVFTGELTGHLLALDSRDGKVLYRFDTGAPLHAGVITYAVEGKQYVAVAAGMATSFWRVPSVSSRVMVFSLP